MQAAHLSVFLGNTMYGDLKRNSYPLGYYPYMHIMFIKGEGTNQASGKWALRSWNGGFSIGIGQSNLGYSTGTASASSFWPELKISGSECKIIIQCALSYDHSGAWGETFSAGPYSGKKCGEVPVRSAFNLYVTSPRGVGSRKEAFFPATIIFTPKPGLFSETPPS